MSLRAGAKGSHLFSATETTPPSFSVSVSLSPSPSTPTVSSTFFFLKGDMGDPDVTFHWPMASREGLDWCALPMPPSFKNA